jgi:hypothetical protein
MLYGCGASLCVTYSRLFIASASLKVGEVDLTAARNHIQHFKAIG